MNLSHPSTTPEPPGPGDLQERTARRVLDRWADSPLAEMLSPTALVLGKLLRRRIEIAISEAGLGLTPAQARSIIMLHFHGPVSQQELAALTEVEPSTLVGILDVMEREDLAVRQPDPADRRAHLVRLTERGQSRVPDLFSLWNRIEAELVEGLDPAAASALRERLQELIDRLSGGEAC